MQVLGAPCACSASKLMPQISRPVQILLGVVVAFLAIWMVALRPKDDEAATPADDPTAQQATQPNAPQTRFGNAVEAARNAAAAETAAAERSAQAGEEQEGAQSAGSSSQPAKPSSNGKPSPSRSTDSARSPRPRRAAARTGPAKVRAGLARGDVVVILFRDTRAPDDRAVVSELAGLDSRKSVTYVSAPVTDVGDYGSVTSAVRVLQSPTVLVISPKRAVSVLTGLVDRATVDEAIAAARRAS